MDQIRVGKISSLNYEKGLARVVYKDRDDAVTIEIPLLSPFAEYYMPEVDDMVYVLHMPNGSVAGLILGRYWTKNNTPTDDAKQGLRRKDLSRSQGKAFWKYEDPEVGDGNDGTLHLHNDDDIDVDVDGKVKAAVDGNVELDSQGTFKVSGATKVQINSDGSVSISSGSGITISCSSGVTIAGGGNVKIDGIQWSTHTHNCTAPGAPSGPPV